MRIYLAVGAITIVAYLAALVSVSRGIRGLSTGWRLLACSGIPLSLAGIGFVLRFWRPTPGPYLANEVYPFGSHLNAWAVSVGFLWIAFGLLFTIVCAQTAFAANRHVWTLLLVTWTLAWLPHVVIGAAFAASGSNQESVAFYRKWASDPAGAIVLGTGTINMLAHFALSVAGFILTGLQPGRRLRA